MSPLTARITRDSYETHGGRWVALAVSDDRDKRAIAVGTDNPLVEGQRVKVVRDGPGYRLA